MRRLIFFFNRDHCLRGLCLLMAVLFLSGCLSQVPVEELVTPTTTVISTATPEITATPLPTRLVYEPATLVDYLAQTGDTLPALASHFNTTEKEIRQANPGLPEEVTTLPPGLPMKIPIYYVALWGTPYQILPDSLFINGPAQIGFDTKAFVDARPGWLKNYSALAGKATLSGGDLIDYIAQEFSISPRLLLAIAEYQAGALTSPKLDPAKTDYTLGYEEQFHKGFYLQLVWAANQLNNGYYQWRTGRISTITHSDGTIEHPDPWQNAASIGIQVYFASALPANEYYQAIGSNGLNAAYTHLFGDPWQKVQAHIPGSLKQPDLLLPFSSGKTWAFTGGPHAGWGDGDPLAAMDFAPPSTLGGCAGTSEFAIAIADGEIVRSQTGVVMLDLDGDGDDRTGWVILYLHIATNDKVRQGTIVKVGDPIGHPSCEGGEATGTHVHVARKYNGEWIPADSAIPFVMEGWVPHNGSEAYQGTLTRTGYMVTASDTASSKSLITAGK